MEDILDLDRFPLHALDSPAGRELVAWCKAELDRVGLFNLDRLVRPGALETCLAEVNPLLATEAFEHKQHHNVYFKKDVEGLSPGHPALAKATTRNRKICADQMPDSTIMKIYEWPPLLDFLATVMEKPVLYMMEDPLARVNVFNYKQGEQLNWHFDRSEFTTTLLLQPPTDGGKFLYRRGLRSDDDPNYDGVANLLAGNDNQIESVTLAPGTLNVFKGKNTLHSVSPVLGPTERVIAVFSYYEFPGKLFSEEERLTFYGRTH
ncbi:MAG: 2OG-Fe(II) oxygenase [Alphaproteobacteria bacterium]